MLRAIIFDFDGVIVDSHPAHKKAWNALFSSLGRNISDDELQFVVEGHKREVILRHFLGELSAEQVRQYGRQKEALLLNLAAEIRLVPGLQRFFTQLDAMNLSRGLATSGSRRRVEPVLKQFNMDRKFQAVVTGEDVLRGKPDPAIFILAAERMRMRPSEVLVCEDAANGVQGAKAAGMKCLAIAANGRGPLLAKAGADKVVPDFTQVSLDELQRLFF